MNVPKLISKEHTRSGFTVLEVLLSVALIGIIGAIGAPIYQRVQTISAMENTLSAFREALRRAQLASQAVDGDATWGVKVGTGTITLFQGASYTTRNASSDELTDYPLTITVGSTTEFVFSKLIGNPLAVGTTTFTSASAGIKTIFVNARGTLE